jgi:diphthine-ammonia ligase
MRCAVMWSGGKDSALAADRARRSGIEIACLVNFYDEATGRVRFHATRTELIAAQAAAIDVPLVQRGTTWPGFDDAFRDTLDVLVGDGIDGVVFGDIHLADVRAWYETRVRAAGLAHVEPLWGGDPHVLLTEFVATGGRAVVTCCESGKLDDSWLGRVIDERFVREIASLPIDPCGENGEYHSFAFAGPLFTRAVPYALGERRSDGRFAQLDILVPRPLPAASR